MNETDYSVICTDACIHVITIRKKKKKKEVLDLKENEEWGKSLEGEKEKENCYIIISKILNKKNH